MKKPPGYAKYIKSARWRNISEAMKKHAKYVCARCKTHTPILEVHHKNYERLGNERMSDLEVLCMPCHNNADRQRVERREDRLEQRKYDRALETYVASKYGGDLIDVSGVEEEFQDWLARKHYGEFGE
jgi:5-methylcytosine-specific restriction endonuclease McrA